MTTQGANVLSIDVLCDLKAALSRFANNEHSALTAAAREIQHTQEWLEQRVSHWRQQVSVSREAIQRASAALARCHASGSRDRNGNYHAPDCSAFEQALRQAEVRLREAETELQRAQQWSRTVHEASQAYKAEARALTNMLDRDLPQATVRLEQAIQDLHAYVGFAPAHSGIAPATSSVSLAIASSNGQLNSSFIDKLGRSIAVRTWESGNQAMVRAFDKSEGEVPEQPSVGQAGYANATLETVKDGTVRVRLNDIMTNGDYRGQGLAGPMLQHVEQYSRAHGATEIYGAIESQAARDFWAGSAPHGWTIEAGDSYYGVVRKRLG